MPAMMPRAVVPIIVARARIISNRVSGVIVVGGRVVWNGGTVAVPAQGDRYAAMPIPAAISAVSAIAATMSATPTMVLR